MNWLPSLKDGSTNAHSATTQLNPLPTVRHILFLFHFLLILSLFIYFLIDRLEVGQNAFYGGASSTGVPITWSSLLDGWFIEEYMDLEEETFDEGYYY